MNRHFILDLPHRLGNFTAADRPKHLWFDADTGLGIVLDLPAPRPISEFVGMCAADIICQAHGFDASDRWAFDAVMVWASAAAPDAVLETFPTVDVSPVFGPE